MENRRRGNNPPEPEKKKRRSLRKKNLELVLSLYFWKAFSKILKF